MEHNHNNEGLTLDSKLAYEVALERLLLKEKEIIELRALCTQLANQLHDCQHMLEDLQKGK